jgi:soluble lytic murein transglycosylase
VITGYPKGDRVPDAYYKMGLALAATKQPDRAREAYETLLKLYPDSELAGLAKQRLAAMARAK